MGRNKNVEAFRAMLILYMLLYHFSVSIPGIGLPFLFTEAFGQFALIGFFVLSGYGTYCYFCANDGKAGFWAYVRRRLHAILPQYYLSLFIILLLTPKVAMWSREGIGKILGSLFLLQNFDSANGINGVTWTVAVLFQLYLVAIPLCRLVKRYGATAWLGACICSVALKRCLFHYIGIHEMDPLYYVVTSIRLPFTTVDLFLTGMFAAYVSMKLKERVRTGRVWGIAALGICAVMVVFYHVGFNFYAVHTGGLWADKWSACIWHLLIAIWQGCLLAILSNLPFGYGSPAGHAVQFMAKHEYGIYLWHMVLLGTFQTYGGGGTWFALLSQEAPYALLAVMVAIAVLVGYLSTVVAKGEGYLKLFKLLS